VRKAAVDASGSPSVSSAHAARAAVDPSGGAGSRGCEPGDVPRCPAAALSLTPLDARVSSLCLSEGAVFLSHALFRCCRWSSQRPGPQSNWAVAARLTSPPPYTFAPSSAFPAAAFSHPSTPATTAAVSFDPAAAAAASISHRLFLILAAKGHRHLAHDLVPDVDGQVQICGGHCVRFGGVEDERGGERGFGAGEAKGSHRVTNKQKQAPGALTLRPATPPPRHPLRSHPGRAAGPRPASQRAGLRVAGRQGYRWGDSSGVGKPHAHIFFLLSPPPRYTLPPTPPPPASITAPRHREQRKSNGAWRTNR
jgi:hypothetical protein